MKCGKFNGAPRPCEYIVGLVRHFKVIAKDYRPPYHHPLSITPTLPPLFALHPDWDPYERLATAEDKTRINKL